MKVCHMTSAHSAYDVRIFKKECVSLSKLGYEVYLVQCGSDDYKDGVKIIGAGEKEPNRLKRVLLYAHKVYKMAKNVDADLYHIHDPELLPYALLLKARHKAIVFDSHERYVEQIKHKAYLPGFLKGMASFLYLNFEKFVASHIDGFIFPCTKDGRNPFNDYDVKVVFIDNFPRLDELYRDCSFKEKKELNRLCYIGTLSYARGVTHIVNALEDVDCRLYLGGHFSPKSYQCDVEKLPGFEKVDYLGVLDRKQVRETLEKSTIGIATLLNVGQYNTYDNLPTKAYEYMAMGLPVVLSDSNYNKEIVQKYGFGICVDPTDTDSFSKALSSLLADTELCKEMGKCGRLAVKEEFNWENEEKKLCDLYKSILMG